MTIQRVLLIIFFLTIATKASALNSTEMKVTLGENYQGYKAVTSVDLDREGIWNTGVSIARSQYADSEELGWNNFYFWELNCFPADSLSISVNYSHTLDNHAVVATGPGVSIFYTRFTKACWDDSLEKKQVCMPRDVFTLGLDCPLLFYRADVALDSDSGDNTIIDLTQTSPMLFLDVSVIPNILNMNVSGSYFFYSEDPAQIAMLIDQATSVSTAGSLESLMLTMLRMSWQTGVFINLPYKMQVSADYGRQKQVYPDEWVEYYDLGFSVRLFRFLKAKAAWHRFSSSAAQNDMFSLAMKFYY